MNYETAVKDKNFIPNVVIFFKGLYWGIREPDSGLSIPSERLGVASLSINPTKVDPYKASTTINSYSFSLTDHANAVTRLFDGVKNFFQNEPVLIYIGRSGVNMDFSEYKSLPITYVKRVSKDRNDYNFSTQEIKDRINRPAFDAFVKLEVDILVGTTEIDADREIDLDVWPSSGLFKLDNEFISYTGIDSINNRFTGCVRGEKLSAPTTHNEGANIYLVQEVVGNPIEILLQIIISKGGGGIYDTLLDGAGIDENLVNLSRFEAIRDEFFLGQVYTLLIYNQSNIQRYLEEQILFPNELRIVTDNTAKLGLVILNRKVFDDLMPTIVENDEKNAPTFEVDDTEIINTVVIEYDFNEGTGKFQRSIELSDQDSINELGKREPLIIQSRGIKEIDNGAQIVNSIAQRILNRFAFPKPSISFVSHMNNSLIQLGDKAEFLSRLIPSEEGELQFAETLEIIERGINWKTGDVKFKLAFTSFTGVRECYLAPSDRILTINNPKSVNIGAGRGSLYRIGWKMKLYSETSRDYASGQVNEIESIVDDTIIFKDNWSVPLVNNQFRIMFCDYDDAEISQKRYCYVSNGSNFFDDERKFFQISF